MRQFLETIGHEVCIEALATLFEAVPYGLSIVDKEGRFIAVNQRLCMDLKYTRAQLLKKKFSEITHPDDLADDMEMMRSLSNGQEDSYGLRKRYLINGSGVYQSYLLVASVRLNGELKFFISQIMPEVPAPQEAPQKQKSTLQRISGMTKAEWIIVLGLVALGMALDLGKVKQLASLFNQ